MYSYMYSGIDSLSGVNDPCFKGFNPITVDIEIQRVILVMFSYRPLLYSQTSHYVHCKMYGHPRLLIVQ